LRETHPLERALTSRAPSTILMVPAKSLISRDFRVMAHGRRVRQSPLIQTTGKNLY